MISFTSHSQKDKTIVTETRSGSAEVGEGRRCGCEHEGVFQGNGTVLYTSHNSGDRNVFIC